MIKKIVLSIGYITLFFLTITKVMADPSIKTDSLRDPFQEPLFAKNNLDTKLIFIHYGNAEAIAKLLAEKNN